MLYHMCEDLSRQKSLSGGAILVPTHISALPHGTLCSQGEGEGEKERERKREVASCITFHLQQVSAMANLVMNGQGPGEHPEPP